MINYFLVKCIIFLIKILNINALAKCHNATKTHIIESQFGEEYAIEKNFNATKILDDLLIYYDRDLRPINKSIDLILF